MNVGIVGYGAHIPRRRIKVEEIAKVWGADAPSYKNMPETRRNRPPSRTCPRAKATPATTAGTSPSTVTAFGVSLIAMAPRAMPSMILRTPFRIPAGMSKLRLPIAKGNGLS